MFDLHCHLLPGIDEGAVDPGMALEMARIAAADGIRAVACTPSILPGVHESTAEGIRAAVASLQAELDRHEVHLRLVEGAVAHLAPGLARGVRSGRIPTIAGSHYLLIEPPRHVVPPRFEESVFELMTLGITPVLAQPESLAWVDGHHEVLVRLATRGAWLQVSTGALTGRQGKRAQYWSEKFVAEGHCHVLATGAHDTGVHSPLMAEAREVAARLVGRDAATHLVSTRPRGVFADADPSTLPPPVALTRGGARREPGPVREPAARGLRELVRGLFRRA
jgi:protein-tyrosine phosphatase